jgi:RHS repeat-associated protein
MHQSQTLSNLRLPALLKTLARLFFRRALQRRVVCCAIALNLLLLPGQGLATHYLLNAISQGASTVLDARLLSSSYEAYFIKRLFSRSTARAHHETMADRATAVAHVQLNPVKFVGYQDEGATFMATPTDALDRTVQGVKFSFQSSNPSKLQIDEAGHAHFLSPGLAWVTCSVGAATATAPVLIRPNHRPRQSDLEWRNDQQALRANGTVVGQTAPDKGIGSALASLADNLSTTAYAQAAPPEIWPGDLGYDQLWNEPRNLEGSPRNAAAASTPLGPVLPEGSNFSWATNIIGLGGRGLTANLTLYYNSRVWSRRNNQVAFDAVTGWPAPGFSLGFGRMLFYDVVRDTGKFLWVEPDGTRHYFGTGSSVGSGYALGGPYETSDGNHLVYSGNARDGGTISYPDGTSVTITAVNNRLLPTTINDRNGNYIQIAYKGCFEIDKETYCDYFAPMAIDYVTDTLGRLIQFQYDSNYRLSAVTAPGFGGTSQNPVTQTLVQFDYQSVSSSYSFTGLTVERAPWSALRLKHVYFPATNTGYLPSYSQYGMVSSVSVRRQMGASAWPPGSPPVITDGVESDAVTFNYPGSGSLSDCPAFSQWTNTAINSPTSIYSFTTSTDSVAQTMTFTVTQPDSSTLFLTRSTNPTIPAAGRLVQSEIKYGAASFVKSVLTYANDGAGSPQIQSATTYDDTGTPVKLGLDYDTHGNITNRREYGFQVSGVWQVRRRTHTTYASIGGAVNLPTEVDVYDALLDTNDANDVMIAKSTLAYDNYVSMGGMENYGGTAAPPGHLSWYDANLTARGNVTGTTQWTDVSGGTVVQHQAKYDIFGNVVKGQVSCCQEKDLTNTDENYWSAPVEETSGDPNGVHQTTSTDYDFNTSLPVSETDAGGLTTNIGYNAALTPSSVTLPTGATATAGYDYGNLSSSTTLTYNDGVDQNGDPITKTLTTSTAYDGWGRVVQSVDKNNAQVNTSYDSSGRVISHTNPFTAGGTPGPATITQYDLANKAIITTLPGGNVTRLDYSGAAVTSTDQVSRQSQRISDGLGRLVTVNEQNAAGALTQATNYTYNLLDNLTQVNQGGQLRSFKYDALGRLLFERIPEQTATINDGTGTYWTAAYAYTEFSSVNKKTDARGVETHNSFDALHRVAQIWYTGVGGNDSGTVRPALPSGVAAIGDTTTGYAGSGVVSSVSVANTNGIGYAYNESYTFDDADRPSSVTRYVDSKPYTTGYQYNEASQVTNLTYPSGNAFNVGHDDRGRTGSVGAYATAMTYNIEARPTGLTLGNGVIETSSFDANRSQLSSQTATRNGATLMSLNYSYDAAPGQSGATTTAGNTHQLISLTGTINGSTESANYTYDLQRRLATSSQTSNGSSAQRRFDYDRWGNRTGVWDATTGGNQIQSVALQQTGGAPTNSIQTVYPPRTNFARSSNGSVATASPTYSSSYVASATINGDRKGTGWGEAGGGWMDSTANTYPDWLQVTFNGSKTIDEIDVFTLQDNYSNPSEPTESMTFSQYGIVAFQVQYWNGLGWITVSGGSITGNNKVWKKINFSQITTSKIRVNVTSALSNYSRITEVEAWGPGLGTNHSYDAAGNVTNDGSHTYTYDAANRLVSVDGGGTAQYAYDDQNQRVKAVSGGATTHYVWDGGHVIAEHDGTAPGQWTTKVEYIYVRESLIATQHYTVGQHYSTSTRYYMRDKWSTRLILDSNGNVIGGQGHLPFGEEFAESGTQEKHHFTSYEAESGIGSDYAVNRQYSQAVARFQSADPYQPSSYLVNPQGWNRYSYVENDPIHNVDPSGLLASVTDPDNPDSGSCGDSTPPEPVASKCDIDAGISGRPRSGISPVSGINSDSKLRLGRQQNTFYWFFFFEVGVSLPQGTSPKGWRFNQSVLRIEKFTIIWNGKLLSDSVVFEDLTDGGLAESSVYSLTARGVHYWIDTPGAPKNRSVKLADGSKVSGPVVSLLTTWEFEWTATYSADPRRSCSKRFRLSITFERGGSPDWTHSFPQ